MLRRLQNVAGGLKRADSTSPTLSSVKTGQFRCVRVHADGVDARRIKRMGLCEGLIVEVLGCGDPMIVLVSHSKLGLSRYLASKIEVVPWDEAKIADEDSPATTRSNPATGEVG